MPKDSVFIKAELHPAIHQRIVSLSKSTGMGREKIYAYAIAYATGLDDFYLTIAAIARGTFFNTPVHPPVSETEKE